METEQRRLLVSSGHAKWIFFGMRFEGLRQYLKDLDVFLKRQRELEHVEWSKEFPDLPTCGPYTDVLPFLLKKSFIVTLMIQAEMFLDLACKDLIALAEPTEVFKRRQKDRSTIEVYQGYIGRNFGFSKPSDELWTDLGAIWEIRNAIVHREAKPDPRRKEQVDAFIAKLGPREPTLLERLMGPDAIAPVGVNTKLCELALDTVEQFLKQLRAECEALFWKIRQEKGITTPYGDYDDRD